MVEILVKNQMSCHFSLTNNEFHFANSFKLWHLEFFKLFLYNVWLKELIQRYYLVEKLNFDNYMYKLTL